MDHNKDNIYEVEVVNINTNDGESAQPISVVQTNIVYLKMTPRRYSSKQFSQRNR